MMEHNILQSIFYEIKPELKEKGDLHGSNLLEDLGFDSVDIIELFSRLEEAYGIEIGEREKLLDIIQEYNLVEKWVEEKISYNNFS